MIRRRIWLIVCAVVLAAPVFGADPSLDQMGELSKKIEALNQKLQQCGSNTACIQQVGQEMVALQQEYVKLAQSTAKSPGAQPAAGQKLAPTCQSFFRPGWSCVSVKMTASYRNERKAFDSYCDPPGILPCNRKEYATLSSVYALTAGGSGILTYTKDFAEFDLFVHGDLASTKVTAFQGVKTWRTETPVGSGNHHFEQRGFPTGSYTVDIPAGLHIIFPAEQGAPTNVFFVAAHSRTTDDWYPYERGDVLSPTLQKQDAVSVEIITPAMMKAAADSRQLVKTYRWRTLDTDGKSYSDNTLNLKVEIGEPPPEVPGALAVSPGDGFSSSRTDPKKSFEPLSKTYTISNKGKQAINYAVSKKATWLKLDNTGGSLAPGGSATVAASVDVPVAGKLTEDTYKDTITFVNTTNAKGNTTRPADLTIGEEQRWQVFLTGYEIDEMDSYWKITTKVRGAIRFDYKLRGEFTIAKKKGKWQYKNGTITIADVGLSNLYEPLSVWMVKPLKCMNCSYVTNLKGGALSGYVDGNIVKLHWGNAWPKVNVEAKITVPCKPMPKCAQWGQRLFVSTEFFDRINNVPLPLKHEGVVKPPKPIISPQGSRWINYTYILRRLK